MGSKWRDTGCTHTDVTCVIKVGKARVLAGSQDELLEHFDWQLVVSAVGYSKFGESPLSGNKLAHERLPKALFNWAPPPCLGLEWRDCGVPMLAPDWWTELATAIRAIEGDIGLCCQGGHGRTGTMLAILAVKLGKVKKGDCPVAWVRKRYCTRAVESDSQLDYIEHITGVKVSSSASGLPALPLPDVKGGMGVNPTNPWFSKPQPTATASGSAAGPVLGQNPTDEELLEAWFQVEGDYVTVTEGAEVKLLRPVWDKEGELAGWQDSGGAG